MPPRRPVPVAAGYTRCGGTAPPSYIIGLETARRSAALLSLRRKLYRLLEPRHASLMWLRLVLDGVERDRGEAGRLDPDMENGLTNVE